MRRPPAPSKNQKIGCAKALLRPRPASARNSTLSVLFRLDSALSWVNLKVIPETPLSGFRGVGVGQRLTTFCPAGVGLGQGRERRLCCGFQKGFLAERTLSQALKMSSSNEEGYSRPRKRRKGKLGRGENLESSGKTNRHLPRLDKIFPLPVYGFPGTHPSEPLRCSYLAEGCRWLDRKYGLELSPHCNSHRPVPAIFLPLISGISDLDLSRILRIRSTVPGERYFTAPPRAATAFFLDTSQ